MKLLLALPFLLACGGESLAPPPPPPVSDAAPEASSDAASDAPALDAGPDAYCVSKCVLDCVTGGLEGWYDCVDPAIWHAYEGGVYACAVPPNVCGD